jgi:hypothetical protein
VYSLGGESEIDDRKLSSRRLLNEALKLPNADIFVNYEFFNALFPPSINRFLNPITAVLIHRGFELSITLQSLHIYYLLTKEKYLMPPITF